MWSRPEADSLIARNVAQALPSNLGLLFTAEPPWLSTKLLQLSIKLDSLKASLRTSARHAAFFSVKEVFKIHTLKIIPRFAQG